VVDGLFREAFESQKRTTLICSIWFVLTIWNTLILLLVSSAFSFKDLLFEFLSLVVNV
jgi:hypothetical protein